MKRSRSMSIKVLVSLVLFLVIILDIGTLTIIMFQNNSKLLREQVERYYETSIGRAHERISSELTLFELSIKQLSKHTLLVNGLIDELGRERYLPPFIQHFSIPGVDSNVDVSLHDFQFELIETSDLAGKVNSGSIVDQEIIIKRVIEEGEVYRTFLQMEEDKLFYLFAAPVFYEGSSEGVLLARMDWNPLRKNLTSSDKGIPMALRYHGKTIASTGNMNVVGEKKSTLFSGQPGLELLTKIPEDIINTPIQSMAKQMLLWGGILLFVSLSFNLLLVGRRITRPIIQLKSSISRVAQGEWPTIQLEKSNREVMELAACFNHMIEELQRTQKELEKEKNKQLENAYQAGMAENAISVLHNIGNAITPAIIKFSMFSSKLKKLRYIEYLEKTHTTIKEQLEKGNLDEFLKTDPRGKKLLLFHQETISKIKEEIGSFEKKADSIRINLEHISHMILLQQKYANFQTLDERIDPKLIMEDTLTMMKDAFKKRAITVETIFPEQHLTIFTNKNKLVQTLLNLLKNSLESIDLHLRENSTLAPKIQIKLQINEQVLNFSIADNGIGADQEVLNRCFEFGFTTKERGTGFGLHDCANFIRANRGEIHFVSSGLGEGAEVRFSLPVDEREEEKGEMN